MTNPAFDCYIREAYYLREQLGTLFRATPCSHLVFVPGLLNGLRLALNDLGIRNLILTSDEYYRPSDFGRLGATLAEPFKLVSTVCVRNPDAVIASVVSWRGRRTNIKAEFEEIRLKMGAQCPLLIADYSHSGAAGWPAISDLGADIVCGDPCKWIAPSVQPTNVGFIWCCSVTHFASMQQTFSPFCLSLSDQNVSALARWVDPSVIKNVSSWHRKRHIDRDGLTAMFQENLRLARMLALRWGVSCVPQTSIVWLEEKPVDPLFDALVQLGLVWERAGGFRVIARADITREHGVLG